MNMLSVVIMAKNRSSMQSAVLALRHNSFPMFPAECTTYFRTLFEPSMMAL